MEIYGPVISFTKELLGISFFIAVSVIDCVVYKLMHLLVWSFTTPSTLLRSCWACQLTYSLFSWAGLNQSPVNQYLVHILLPVTDNCPTWIRGRERRRVEIDFLTNLYEKMWRDGGINLWPPECGADCTSRPGLYTSRLCGLLTSIVCVILLY